ncbi:hypothetical protein [Actinomadura parmotrematis]|uniref:Uncharacterized protein n=1 Tax=Actinomadura parmotrematis TaxID=2864039 RepID=A0ABS7FN79_9ACTN|nr:hypothetical protein [Actinomadura parmotrematis]MBW8481047.1 hypothetical protein [Actinomadura parmotrematis]
MDVAGLHLTYAGIALFGLGLFLLAGVFSLLRQGLKAGAVIVLVLAALAFAGGVMWQ